MLADLASQQILETNKKLPKKIKSADTLSSELWKRCNKNDDSLSCKTVGVPNLSKCKYHQRIDELLNDYTIKRLNHTDKVIIDKIWEPKNVFNPVRIAFEQTDNDN